jgi:enamine deaminase RidA (YjgF/YER057c/UK114 family)
MSTTTHETINPWTWQDQFGFAQAVRTSEPPSRWVVCAGQAAHDETGAVVHPGDMHGQLTQTLDNLETVLAQAGTDLGHVIRLNYYTTDVDGLLGVWGVLLERLGRAGCTPASTLLGVTRLAFPDMLVEIEATALVP